MENSPAPALKADNVFKSFGCGTARTDVLKGVSIETRQGAFEALMGPSGSGKSTFIHIACGLTECDSGTVEIGGEKATGISDSSAAKLRRRKVGVVFQDFNLVSSLNVAENIVLPVKLDGEKPSLARLEHLLSRLGLNGKSGRLPEELSGGEKQRVAVARALFAHPAVLLADEPTGNLDIASAKELVELLTGLCKAEGVAALVVTHDPFVASAASRVHFMKDGRIAGAVETSGNPALVSEKYLEICK
jgi:putative ABC transport system ATP-binding protein